MIRRKLTSNAGTSIVFAMVIFMLCAIFAAAMIRAAHTAAGNAIEQRFDEQDFLSVSSAARLVQAVITGGAVTETTTYGPEETETVSYEATPGDDLVLTALTDMLAAREGDEAVAAEKEFTVTADEMSDVTVALRPAGTGYDFTAEVSTDQNRVLLSFAGMAGAAEDGYIEDELVWSVTELRWTVSGSTKRVTP